MLLFVSHKNCLGLEAAKRQDAVDNDQAKRKQTKQNFINYRIIANKRLDAYSLISLFPVRLLEFVCLYISLSGTISVMFSQRHVSSSRIMICKILIFIQTNFLMPQHPSLHAYKEVRACLRMRGFLR